MEEGDVRKRVEVCALPSASSPHLKNMVQGSDGCTDGRAGSLRDTQSDGQSPSSTRYYQIEKKPKMKKFPMNEGSMSFKLSCFLLLPPPSPLAFASRTTGVYLHRARKLANLCRCLRLNPRPRLSRVRALDPHDGAEQGFGILRAEAHSDDPLKHAMRAIRAHPVYSADNQDTMLVAETMSDFGDRPSRPWQTLFVLYADRHLSVCPESMVWPQPYNQRSRCPRILQANNAC